MLIQGWQPQDFCTLWKSRNSNLLKIFSLIFPKAEVLFNVLQKKSFDINFCNKKIESFKSEIMLLKSSFHLIWNSVVDTDNPPPEILEEYVAKQT